MVTMSPSKKPRSSREEAGPLLGGGTTPPRSYMDEPKDPNHPQEFKVIQAKDGTSMEVAVEWKVSEEVPWEGLCGQSCRKGYGHSHGSKGISYSL